MNNWGNRILGLGEMNPNEIKQNPNNYRFHPEPQRRMMDGTFEEIGWIQAVIINKTTGNLIDGHMRVQMAIEKGEEKIPVIMVELSEEEENKALASFDPIGSFAKEERDKLTDLLAGVTTRTEEMHDLLAKVAKRNRIKLDAAMSGADDDEEDPFDKEEKKQREEEERRALVEKWGVEPGQIWLIESQKLDGGVHRLMCGDSAVEENVDKLMDGATASLMVTDPPYGISFENKFNPRSKDWAKIDGDEKKGEGLRTWLSGVLRTWMRSCDAKASYYLWSAVFEEGFAIYHAMQDAGIHIQSQIVWGKNAFSLGQTDYHWQHEICWYGFVKGAKHNWYGGRDQSTLWSIHKIPNQQYIHPMQKPLELYSVPIKNHTKAGEICVDPFSGSGTQIEAAEKLARLCYAMENDPVWVATSLERFHKLGLEVSKEDGD